MKKILLSISLVSSQVIFSQIYTPGGAVNTTENPATGNVGIGSVNPESILDIKANGNIPIIRGNGGYIPTGLRFIDDSYTQLGQVKEWSIWKGNTWAKGLGFHRYDAVNKCAGGICDISLFLHDNGNVGIGTLTPTSKLTVAGDIAYGENFTNTLFRDDAGAFGTGVKSGFYQALNPVNFPTGATSWWHLLDIRHSNPVNNYAMQFSGSFFDQDLWFRKTNHNAQQPWRRVIMEQSNGNVGIGTSNPQYKLEVAGSTAVKGVLYVHGADLSLGKGDGRAQGNLLDQRALVHGDTDILWLNYGGDFEGGTQIGNGSFFKNDGNASLQGKLEAKEVKVTTTPTADFVFEKDYQLPTLEEVEKHIKENKHLPEIASAKQMEKEGVNVGEFQIKLLQKIEELTLYSIEQNKLLKKQTEKIENQSQKIEKLSVENQFLQTQLSVVRQLEERLQQLESTKK
jgi:hypothetical protein